MENGPTEKKSAARKRSWFNKHLNWKIALKRQQCLAYYQEELKLKVFQEKEADLYNQAVARCSTLTATDNEVAKEMLPAAGRQAESANEILRRRGKMASIPGIASGVYFAWQVAYSDYLAWATAQAAAVSAVADGMAPHAKRVDRILSRSQKSRHKAEGKEKKFLRRLGLSKDEVRKLLVQASMAVASENWQPQEQPANELESLHRRVSQLESSVTERKEAEEESRKRHDYLEEVMGLRTAEVETAKEQLQREVAERRQMEEALRQSEERYRQFVELASDGVAVQIDGKLVFANNAAARLLGAAEPEQVVGQPMMDFTPPNYRQIVQEQVREVIEGRRTAPIEYKLTRPDGVDVDVEVMLTPTIYQGKPAVQTVFRDVTEHKKMQKQLTNELELLRQRLTQLAESELEDKRAQEDLRVKDSAIASSISAIAIADLEGNLTYVNPSFLRMWRYDDDKEVLGRPATELWQMEDKALEILETVRDRGSWVGELAALAKDGSLFDVQVSASRIIDESGELLGFMASFVDIGEQKKMQEQLIVSDRLASLSEMASGFAHELNNRLTSVIGFSGLLLNKDIPEYVRKDIETIHAEGQRAADVIRNLLPFAQAHPTAKQPTDVNSTIQSVLKMREYQHKASNIRVNTYFSPDLPAIVAVPSQLQQVFLYIVMNAEYFMVQAHGGGTLTVTTERVEDIVKASFSDDGPGISEEDLAHIFDPFFTTKEVGRGTGLGLSVCHGIITGHGGRMYAESKLGKGAAFVVELPVVAEDKRPEPGEPVADESSRVSGVKILVVDDEPAILEFLSQVLADEGHHVETIDSANDALERIRNKRYRLILLDVEMPGISGIALYKHFQEIAESLAKRVVFITGDTLGADTRDFLSKTKAPCIAKPFDAGQLEKDIERILAHGA